MDQRRVFALVIPAVAICVLGLLGAQIKWFKEATQLKDRQFQDKAYVLLNHAGIAINRDSILRTALLKYLNDPLNCDSSVESNQMIIEGIGQLLDSVFRANQIQMEFHFAILEGCDEPILKLSNLPDENSNQLEFQTQEALSCFLPGDSQDHILGLNFPKKDRYLLKQTRGMIGISTTLLLVLMAAFFYLLNIIRKQKKLSQIKNDLISNLTHEFKTPIASISLASKVLQKGKREYYTNKDWSYLNLIRQESKRLENHVDKVLQPAMLDSGNFNMDRTPVNIHLELEKVAMSCDILLKARHGSFVKNFKAENSIVIGDPSHLFNLFYNLFDNAIKYSREKPEVVVSTENSNGNIICSFKDNGIGMTKQVQRNIFEKFYRAKTGNIHNVKGFGLGLSYVKNIVRAHKGSIQFTSILGQGTEFVILLPTVKTW